MKKLTDGRRTPSDGNTSPRTPHIWARTYICISHIRPWSGVGVMVFNATFNKISVISWRSVSLVEETGVPHIWNKYCPTIWLTAWITTFSRILSLFDQLIEFLHENSHQFPFNIINELTTLNIFWHFGRSRNRFSFFYQCITIYLHSQELNFQILKLSLRLVH